MKIDVFTIPGWLGSEPEHWQSHWEHEDPNINRVIQDDWEQPDLQTWLNTLNTAIQSASSPCILAAHSLGCSLVNHWATRYDTSPVIGVLFVAPADVDSKAHTPNVLRGFSPMPLVKLPFPSIVVASNNDPYVSVERAKYFANTWGSRFIDHGACGHINADSGLASWPYGKTLLEELAR